MVSNRNVKQRGNTVVSKRFGIPPGLIDVVRDTNIIPLDVSEEDQESIENDPSVGITDTNDPTESGGFPYSPPTTVTIVSQKVRVLADGSHVVDVVIDIDDVYGVTEYDVRTSKS